MKSTIFKGTARLITDMNGLRQYWYHNTPVLSVLNLNQIKLNTGGFYTNTTKKAMNQALDDMGLIAKVFAKKGDWFISINNETIPFNDDMLIVDL